MKKKLLIVSINYPAQESIMSYIKQILKGYVEIECSLCRNLTLNIIKNANLVIFSMNSAYEKSYQLLDDNIDYVICGRSIDYNHIEEILTIPPGTDVYCVNDSLDSTEAVISQLLDLGITQYNFFPFYPGCQDVNKSIKIAVTAGEVSLVPDYIDNIIDIGSRIVDTSTVYKIITKLELPINIINEVERSYSNHIIELLKSSNSQLGKIYKTHQILQAIINNIDNGVCLINEQGIIQMINKNFNDMVFVNEKNIIYKNLFDLLKKYKLNYNLETILNSNYVVKNANRDDIIINANEIQGIFDEKYYLINANYTEYISSKEIAIRQEVKNHTEEIHYDFTDYLTIDERVIKSLENIKKISLKDANVLIQGESGTGKEIIAQTIHGNSHRKSNPFVAVNFAAIQSNLLESELFGYEEGSFTGAKKGGKKGLFEIAHRGTIFLDEVGDAPMSFQTRLLRALQEHEIRRVGGVERIPIDVRVIAATNKDLYKLIEKGKFREDLFYRLNVMPIYTIPLRERQNDIELIFNHYLKNNFNNSDITIDYVCSKLLIDYLLSYDWPGNIRELINICEYFSCIKTEEKIRIKDLPKYMILRTPIAKENMSSIEKDILKIIYENPKIGRSKIYNALQDKSINITDGKIRSILNELAEKDLIKINKTKGGCEITEIAEAILAY